MSLKRLSEHIRTYAAPQHEGPAAQGTLTIDVEALAEELEALAAIFTNDHDDDPSQEYSADGGEGGEEIGTGAFHVLQIDVPNVIQTSKFRSPTIAQAQEGDVPSVDVITQWQPGCRLRLMLNTSFQPSSADDSGDGEDPERSRSIPIRLAITIPPSYPSHTNASEEAQRQSAPPQLQLLSRFVGPYAVDPTLFGSVLRTFLHYHPATDDRTGASAAQVSTFASSPSDEKPLTFRNDQGQRGRNEGVPWMVGEPLLYEGIEYVRELVANWYENRRHLDRKRAMERRLPSVNVQVSGQVHVDSRRQNGDRGGALAETTVFSVPAGLNDKQRSLILKRLVRTEPVTERKSVFIAHAARLDHPDEVPIVLSHILSDRKIARATHPIIHAWVCTVPTEDRSKGEVGSAVTVHRDHDDDGETAAGGRLAHLLDLLDVPNAIVVVTRYYGGILLGADRFKHINRVARSGLELAGLVAT
ncbi:unnamed protein product [Tilletia controversa]|uniref:Impact N-terminal domain-containing protein n=3 Tax=Tilletia TaxID=13289 RepID=A0A8X7SUS7_9BASI|nr:hypothetical protein CF328_g8124 [Tilletia controversa]KAE8186123.1 hypothetical protein CF335_g7538 [Tilletia laevis]KAE8254215.1 hypothetical protein A4X03_0g5753 [Tilletia caries]KAE8192557.1 hypothetical protein CF336_g4382 [Tilletia laevis]KAE8242404.1 hypothetical protein A4X06_0g6934 [Tilletia controversa]